MTKLTSDILVKCLETIWITIRHGTSIELYFDFFLKKSVKDNIVSMGPLATFNKKVKILPLNLKYVFFNYNRVTIIIKNTNFY